MLLISEKHITQVEVVKLPIHKRDSMYVIRKRNKNSKEYNGDSKEMIQKCLNCKKPKCNNCLADGK